MSDDNLLKVLRNDKENLVEVLKDIYLHLKGGAPLYPGSLIFPEDTEAVEVIRTTLEDAGWTDLEKTNVHSR